MHFDGRPAVIVVRQRGHDLIARGPADLSAAKLRRIAARLVNGEIVAAFAGATHASQDADGFRAAGSVRRAGLCSERREGASASALQKGQHSGRFGTGAFLITAP
jgi:hypothetical protein